MIVGFCNAEVNEAGPVQLYVKVSGGSPVAVSDNVPLLHKGLLLPAVGATGGAGSVKVTATAVEGQPSGEVTLIPVYAPADRPVMMTWPEALAVIETVTGVLPTV